MLLLAEAEFSEVTLSEGEPVDERGRTNDDKEESELPQCGSNITVCSLSRDGEASTMCWRTLKRELPAPFDSMVSSRTPVCQGLTKAVI